VARKVRDGREKPCDRGYFLLLAPLTAAVFVWMALSPISHASLYAGMSLVMVTFRFVAAAHQGLIALIGQERLMTGRLAALWQFVGNIPAAAGAFASGYAAENLEPRQTLLAAAGIAVLIGVMGAWKPRAVFDHTYDEPIARGAGFRADIARLVSHKAIYPVAAIGSRRTRLGRYILPDPPVGHRTGPRVTVAGAPLRAETTRLAQRAAMLSSCPTRRPGGRHERQAGPHACTADRTCTAPWRPTIWPSGHRCLRSSASRSRGS
jgi:hypothetical protein